MSFWDAISDAEACALGLRVFSADRAACDPVARRARRARSYALAYGPLPPCANCGRLKPTRRGRWCSRPECKRASYRVRWREAKAPFPSCTNCGASLRRRSARYCRARACVAAKARAAYRAAH